jgi:sugar phosphate isomerase/epimerase
MQKLGTAIYTYIWDLSLHEAIERAAQLGFRAIEVMTIAPQLDPRTFSQQDREELVSLCDRLGVEIVSLNPTFIDLNLASRNDTIRRVSIEEVKSDIDLAKDIGAEIVVVGPGRRHPLVLEPMELSRSLAEPAIMECVEYAEKREVIYGFENITSRFMVHSDEIAEFIDKVDSPYCQAVVDVANAYYVEDPADFLRNLDQRVCHVHLSDTDGKVEAHWPVGEGEVDFAAVAQALDDIDFDRWSMLETTWPQDPDGSIISSLPKLRELGWEPVPPTPNL